MTNIPTGGIGPNKDVSVQSAKLEKVRDKTSDKVQLNSKGTSEVSRPSMVAKAKEALGLNALKTFLGKKSTSGAVDNVNIAKTTAHALNSSQSVHPAKPKSEGLGPQFSGPMNEKQTAADFDFLDSLTSQPKPNPQERSSRPVARPLASPGQRSNSNVMSENKLKEELDKINDSLTSQPKPTSQERSSRPVARPFASPGQRSNSDVMSENKLKEELGKINDVPPPPDLPPALPDDFSTDLPPSDLPPALPDDFSTDLPPSDLPPEWSDDLLPEHNDFPTDLPPAWSDDLLPKEGEAGWKEPTESQVVTGDKAVDQSAKNELTCRHIFNEIVSTEATYLSGLREFNAILDDAVKQRPTNQKLISLSQDHKAHLAKAEAFSNELNRVKDATLDTPKKVIQLYDEKLMEGYATSISSLACNYGTNLKVIDELKKEIKSIYPNLDQAELAKKTTILADRGIILPIQRMPRHVMLIMETKKNAPQNETELNAVLDRAVDLTKQINEDKRKSEIEESNLKSVTGNKKKSSFFRR